MTTVAPAATAAAASITQTALNPIANAQGAATRRFEASPDSALATIAAFKGPVLVDLDETLYLRNSTEDFISAARPALVALLLLRLLEILKPWRWTGGDATRDVWRVRLVCLAFPWTLGRWRSRAGQLARQFANVPLLETLRARPEPPTIITVGFLPIVVPLLAGLDIARSFIVAARVNTFVDRRLGKLHAAVERFGEDTLRQSLFLTDSLQDESLLQICASPLWVNWPDARYRRALSEVYLPGQYISQVKRPGEHYFRRAVMQEDFAFWILGSVALAAAPVFYVAGLFFFLLSFWVVYERGYVDNDLMAAAREQDPKLTAAFHDAMVATPVWQPWIWSAAFALVGDMLLRRTTVPLLGDCIRWGAVLVGTYLWFVLYNRSPKPARVWMFAALQFARAASFLVLVPILPIGAVAVGAHVLARWVPYYMYRLPGRGWPDDAEVGMIRLLFFAVLAILLGAVAGWPAVFNWTAGALLLCSIYRARDEIKRVRSKWAAAASRASA